MRTESLELRLRTSACPRSSRTMLRCEIDIEYQGQPIRRYPRRTQIGRLAQGAFLEGATNLCIFGNPGVGKTHVMEVARGEAGSALVTRAAAPRSCRDRGRQQRRTKQIKTLATRLPDRNF